MMTTQLRPRRVACKPEIAALESRTLLAASPISAGAQAYVNQLYYSLLDRPADPPSLAFYTAIAERGANGRAVVARDILRSSEYQTDELNGFYESALGRAPTAAEQTAGLQVLASKGGYLAFVSGVLSSSTYYQAKGGTNVDYVRALDSLLLGQGYNANAESLVSSLNGGTSQSAVVSQLLTSQPVVTQMLNTTYAQLLFRPVDAGSVTGYTAQLDRGVSFENIIGQIVSSTEYYDANKGVTQDIVGLAEGDPDLSTLVQAVTAAGLASTLEGAGPFTVFAPTNEAFAALPAGTLSTLLANPTELAQVLEYHVVPGQYSAPQVLAVGTLPTVGGQLVGVDLDSAGDPRINASNLIQTDIKATNGIVHTIGSVLSPPTEGVLGTLEANPDFSTLVSAVEAAGLTSVLAGSGPFTILAPTNEAFAKIPAATLSSLIANPSELAQVLEVHVIPGEYSTSQLLSAGVLPTALTTTADVFSAASGGTIQVGTTLNFQATSGVSPLANIVSTTAVPANIVATNGIIVPIDTVLSVPTS